MLRRRTRVSRMRDERWFGEAVGLTEKERAKREAFGFEYRQGLLPAMRAIERSVCGCAYGSTAWTTRAEADRIAAALELRAGMALLEVGAGSGWPALYLARETGCEVVLTDLPLEGLGIARERAARDGVAEKCPVACVDGACLPFGDETFDAINHSDVLCCLVEKRSVLSECLRVVRQGGRMAFSVLYIPPGLSPIDYGRALETAPEFVETDVDYPTLLDETGWILLERRDLTVAFMESCRKRLHLETERQAALRSVIGPEELEARLEKLRRRIPVLEQGLLRRDLFLAVPAAPLDLR